MSVNRNPNVVRVNLTDHDARILDALVKSGVGDSRAGALAWCVRHFKEVDWPSAFADLFTTIGPADLPAKEKDEKRVVHRVATRVGKRLDKMIMETPTGDLRDLLVDASLVIDIYRNGSLQSVARRLENAARERDIQT